MITKEEVLELLKSTETFRVERTTSTGDMDKFCEAICAFSNDLPDSKKKGYLIIGAKDNGQLSGLKVSDDLLKKIAAIRSDGNILPLPIMTVDRFSYSEGDLLVVEVTPTLIPPLRYRGRTFVRVGPRRDIATEAEERILTERRTRYMATFDTTPCMGATLNDIDTSAFVNKFLVKAVSSDLLSSDTRAIKEQMAAVGMYDMNYDCPTNAAIILFGIKPRKFFPGAYVQFVRFKGEDKTTEIDDERQFEGNYCEMLPQLESFIELSVIKRYPVPVSVFREETITNYPYWAIRELMMNACMHRDLQSNAPIRLYEYADHIEIMNPGGLYGDARPENFPNVNDYRNPLIASSMRTLGYVNMFNRGVGQVQIELEKNGNPPAEFSVNLLTAFAVNIKKATSQKMKRGQVELLDNQNFNKDNTAACPLERGKKGVKLSREGASQYKPFGPKVLTIQERVVEFCVTPKSMTEIAEFLGIKSRSRARERYVVPQLGITLKMTIPDKPKSSSQKYVAIKKDDK